jgi:hypothetical protein
MTVSDTPSVQGSDLSDADQLAQDLWQANRLLVQTLARLEIAAEMDRQLQAARLAEIDSLA